MKTWEDFDNIVVVDYEFSGGGGNHQKPLCYVAKNLTTNTVIKQWVQNDAKPLYPVDKNTLFIAYFASAELRCHKVLNFSIPTYILDLYSEFRCLTNGLPLLSSLLGACDFFGIKHSDLTYKKSMRELILTETYFNGRQKQDILDYCQQDVELTAELFLKMKKSIDLKHALLRGHYSNAVASMEYNGIPIDQEKLQKLKDCWDIILEELIYKVDRNYNIYDGTTFKIENFQNYLKENNIPWDVTETGLPRTDLDYMHQQAKIFPKIKPLQELRHTLGQLRLKNLQVGNDNRNRCLISPFRSKTGRNQPSTSKFIFGPSTWVRFLIKPEPNTAIAYIDYEQQEIAIAAVLSQDQNLINDYKTGDPYLAFAKKAGAIPADGTKKTHPQTRDIYKRCMLALNYGMSTESFARDVQISYAEANYIVKWHKRRYKKYWNWIDSFIDQGFLKGYVQTYYNWFYQTRNAKYRTLQNWPMQSHGADILRLAICLCVENNIKVIAPVHDAILIEAPIEKIKQDVKTTQQIMEYATKCILDFPISTDVKIVKYPNNFVEPRGQVMWDSIWEIVNNINPAEIEDRLKEKEMEKAVSLDEFKPKKPKIEGNYTKKRRGQLQLKPQNISEKQLAKKIREKYGWNHISIMHLIIEARNTDFDLEHEIDWKYDSYDTAKQKIQQKKTIKDVLTGGY